VKADTGATRYSLQQDPGEIQDLLRHHTENVEGKPSLGKALVGIWLRNIA